MRHKIATSDDAQLDIGAEHENRMTTMVYSYGILWAWLWLNVAMIFGYHLDQVVQAEGLKLPFFVSCLIGSILIDNARNLLLKTDGV
jgi:ESS family glutamate:Na+ symporter